MKIDLRKQLVDLQGEPTFQTTAKGYNLDGSPKELIEVPLTFALVIKTSLNYMDREKPNTPEVSFKRGELICKINESLAENTEVDFTAEQITDIKELAIKAGFPPITVYQLSKVFTV